MKVGDHVTCACAPVCARSWEPGHGPCVSGVLIETDEEPPEPGLVLVRQDNGGASYLVDIGYGQAVRRVHSPEVWALAKSLRIAPQSSTGDE